MSDSFNISQPGAYQPTYKQTDFRQPSQLPGYQGLDAGQAAGAGLPGALANATTTASAPTPDNGFSWGNLFGAATQGFLHPYDTFFGDQKEQNDKAREIGNSATEAATSAGQVASSVGDLLNIVTDIPRLITIIIGLLLLGAGLFMLGNRAAVTVVSSVKQAAGL